MQPAVLGLLVLLFVAGTQAALSSRQPARTADKCVPANVKTGLCMDIPESIGSMSRSQCVALNDPRKGDVMSGMRDECIDGLEQDGPDCLQAALDLACSYHCGACVPTEDNNKGYVEAICPEVCEAVTLLCPVSHGQMDCFKMFDLQRNCRADMDCSRTRVVRGDLAILSSDAASPILPKGVAIALALLVALAV